MINKNTKGIRSGRFTRGLDPKALSFSSSLAEDERLIPYDLACGRAHVRMLGRQGIITRRDRDRLIRGLDRIRAEHEAGVFRLRARYEDVHMNVEARLKELTGAAADVFHTARSRNDLIAADLRLYLRDAVVSQMRSLTWLQAVTVVAGKYGDRVIPGFTHLQPAQPITFSFYRLSWFWKFRRDFEGLLDLLPRINVSPLGAGALCGTTHPIDPDFTARLLGFDRLFTNALDTVADRDFMLETAFRLAQIMLHVSQLAEDLIVLATPDIGFLEIDDAYATGSSIMPQKKNPDICELLRAKASTALGSLNGLAALLKGLPGGYNRDLQEMKGVLFRLIDDTQAGLTMTAGLMKTLRVTGKALSWSGTPSFAGCTDLVDHLVRNGWRFRRAYHSVAACVRAAQGRTETFIALGHRRLKLPPAVITEILKPAYSVRSKVSTGSTGPAQTLRQRAEAMRLLKAQRKLTTKLNKKYRLRK